MAYFDLNIPYHESERHAVDKPSLKGRRLKLALKSMELGYTAVAYDRTLRGVMSDSDRCSTPLFPLSKLNPNSSSSSFLAAVKLHRHLLNVAVSSPFRQYTRLTVVVDISSQSSALNAANPVLRSYDVVAVRPINQNAFDQACQTAEVDMIAIDFTEKLPFRLKQPMVKAAIKRGLYFEITYSGLIADVQTRRQMISNCKLLVDWTRGKNLIISSGAPSVTELRGPQDVANLFSLLGLSTERAKAAISKNCRSLLDRALKKKHFYKEAVKVEEIPSGGQFNPAQSPFDDWLKWDPISSGEGDILLDDMEKSFAISNTQTQTVKAINFTSNMNGLPVHGLHIKDLISVTKAALDPPEIDKFEPYSMELETADEVKKSDEQGGLIPLHEKQSGLPENQASDTNLSKEQIIQASDTYLSREQINEAKVSHQASGFEDSEMSFSPTLNGTYSNPEETEILNYSNDLEANCIASEIQLRDSPSQVYGGNGYHDGGEVITKIEVPITDNHVLSELSNPLSESNTSAFTLEELNVENQCGVGICAREGIIVEDLPSKIESENNEGLPLASSDSPSQDVYVGEQNCEMTDSSSKLCDGVPTEELLNLKTDFNEPISEDVMREREQIDPVTNSRGLVKPQAGRERRKRNSSHRPTLFPFKRFLNYRPSKRKSWR